MEALLADFAGCSGHGANVTLLMCWGVGLKVHLKSCAGFCGTRSLCKEGLQERGDMEYVLLYHPVLC